MILYNILTSKQSNLELDCKVNNQKYIDYNAGTDFQLF
jgi:hypothetical protein